LQSVSVKVKDRSRDIGQGHGSLSMQGVGCAHPKRAGVHGRRAVIGILGQEGQCAGAVLRDHAVAVDHVTVGQVRGVGEDQRRSAGHVNVARDGAVPGRSVATVDRVAQLQGAALDQRVASIRVAGGQQQRAGAGLDELAGQRPFADRRLDVHLRHCAAALDPDRAAGFHRGGQLDRSGPDHRMIGRGRGGAEHERVVVGHKALRCPPNQRTGTETYRQIRVGGREAAVAHPRHRTGARNRRDRATERARGLQHTAGENQAATLGEAVDRWRVVVVGHGEHSLLNAGVAGVGVVAQQAQRAAADLSQPPAASDHTGVVTTTHGEDPQAERHVAAPRKRSDCQVVPVEIQGRSGSQGNGRQRIQPTVGAYLERARVHGRCALIGILGQEGQCAGAVLRDRAIAADHAIVGQVRGVGEDQRRSAGHEDVARDGAVPGNRVAQLQGAAVDRRDAAIRVGGGQQQRGGAGLPEPSGAAELGLDVDLRRSAGAVLHADHVAGCTGQLHRGCPDHRMIGRGGAEHERVVVGHKALRCPPNQRTGTETYRQIRVGGREAAVAHPRHRTGARNRRDRATECTRGLQHTTGKNQAATLGEAVDRWRVVIVGHGEHSLLNAGAAGVGVVAQEAQRAGADLRQAPAGTADHPGIITAAQGENP